MGDRNLHRPTGRQSSPAAEDEVKVHRYGRPRLGYDARLQVDEGAAFDLAAESLAHLSLANATRNFDERFFTVVASALPQVRIRHLDVFEVHVGDGRENSKGALGLPGFQVGHLPVGHRGADRGFVCLGPRTSLTERGRSERGPQGFVRHRSRRQRVRRSEVKPPVHSPCHLLGASVVGKIDAEQGGKDFAGPAINVISRHGSSHLLNPPAAFFRGHFQGQAHSVGDFVHGEGVHEHGIAKLPRRLKSGENSICTGNALQAVASPMGAADVRSGSRPRW
jgi:hypothetical protein